MTITEPIPDVQYGKGDWQDYISNWREKDAEWMQERTILRYTSGTTRSTDWPSPRAGQVTYNEATKTLEMWSAVRATWVSLQMYQYLTSVDASTGVTISHTGATGKGLTLAPALTSIDTPVNLTNGVLTTTANNVAVQTPSQKKAILSTNATDLVSDTPVSVPGLKVTAGTVDMTGRTTTVGALTATSLALGSGTMSTTGAVSGGSFAATGALSGGTLTVTGTGTINGVTFPAANQVNASAGFVAQSGYHGGDANGAIFAYRNPAGGAVSAHQLQAHTDHLDLYGGQSIMWHNTAGSGVAWIAPTIISPSATATDWPDGTIWIQS